MPDQTQAILDTAKARIVEIASASPKALRACQWQVALDMANEWVENMPREIARRLENGMQPIHSYTAEDIADFYLCIGLHDEEEAQELANETIANLEAMVLDFEE